MVLPRMFMVSREMGSWFLGVMRTLRRAVFICGDTDIMVPWTIVPAGVGVRFLSLSVRGAGGRGKGRRGRLELVRGCDVYRSSTLQ